MRLYLLYLYNDFNFIKKNVSERLDIIDFS